MLTLLWLLGLLGLVEARKLASSFFVCGLWRLILVQSKRVVGERRWSPSTGGRCWSGRRLSRWARCVAFLAEMATLVERASVVAVQSSMLACDELSTIIFIHCIRAVGAIGFILGIDVYQGPQCQSNRQYMLE